jgi:glutamate-ammonia-ligase adenylyltransferase
MAASEYYDAVASHTIRLLKDSTRYGRLYDIDARLRPDGNKGMLTMNDRRLAEYYTTEAQAWERLALVKVRAVAGDADFGATVAQRARDIAFELPLTADTMEEVERIRRKIVENVSPLDLKKDVGGIAEIEFTVRLLQLRYAAQYPELKRGDVLGAIDVLAKNALVDAETFGALAGAYLLFRKIENRIRMMHGRSGSALPESKEAQSDLARRLRIEGALTDVAHEHKERAHAIYERIAREITLDQQSDNQ